MVALSGLCIAVCSLFGGPDSALSPEPDCTPDALAMHRHSLKPDLFPLVEPYSEYLFYDCDSGLGGGGVAGGTAVAAAAAGSDGGDGGGASGAGAIPIVACSKCASLVLCAGVGALGVSSAFAESMVTLT